MDRLSGWVVFLKVVIWYFSLYGFFCSVVWFYFVKRWRRIVRFRFVGFVFGLVLGFFYRR